jgi:hypothetical protein
LAYDAFGVLVVVKRASGKPEDVVDTPSRVVRVQGCCDSKVKTGSDRTTRLPQLIVAVSDAINTPAGGVNQGEEKYCLEEWEKILPVSFTS